MISVRRSLSLLMAALLASHATMISTALAAAPPEDEANSLAIAGRYQEALEAYGKLYSASRHPTFLYNIARCHHRLGHPEEAISYYQLYLRDERNVADGKRKEIAGFIREMEALREARQKEKEQERARAAVAAAPPPAPAVVAAVPPQASPVPSPGARSEPSVEAKRQAPPESDSFPWVRTSGFVLGGIGLVATATGGVIAYDGAGAANEAKQRLETASRTGNPDAYDAAYATAKPDFDAAKERNELGWKIVGIGAAGLVAGALLVVLSPSRPATSGSLALAPVVRPGSAGLILEGRW